MGGKGGMSGNVFQRLISLSLMALDQNTKHKDASNSPKSQVQLTRCVVGAAGESQGVGVVT